MLPRGSGLDSGSSPQLLSCVGSEYTPLWYFSKSNQVTFHRGQMAWCQAAAPFLLPASGSLRVPICDTKARFNWLDYVQVSVAPGPLWRLGWQAFSSHCSYAGVCGQGWGGSGGHVRILQALLLHLKQARDPNLRWRGQSDGALFSEIGCSHLWGRL